MDKIIIIVTGTYDSIDEIKEMMKNDRDNSWQVISI